MAFELKATYSIILDMIYMQGGNLPDDARYISGILGVSVRKWNTLRSGLIDSGKIQVIGEFLTNYRAVSEIETLSKFQYNQREKASKPRKNNGLDKATAEPKPSHTEPEPEVKIEANASPKKRGTRLPDDWVLPRDWGAWAVDEGWPENVIRLEAEKFRDYWHSAPGQKGVKLNWLATWRNWMRNSSSPKIVNGGNNDKPSKQQDRFDAFMSGATAGP